jgi:hypothetical protein
MPRLFQSALASAALTCNPDAVLSILPQLNPFHRSGKDLTMDFRREQEAEESKPRITPIARIWQNGKSYFLVARSGVSPHISQDFVAACPPVAEEGEECCCGGANW